MRMDQLIWWTQAAVQGLASPSEVSVPLVRNSPSELEMLDHRDAR
jgi:hypothetical protein